jgi:hypothetical protein
VAGLSKHCRLPEGVVPLAFVVLGYPAEEPPQQNRFDKKSFILTFGDAQENCRGQPKAFDFFTIRR